VGPLEAALPHVLEACERDGPSAGRRTLGGHEAWFKGSHLSGRARARHALRSGLLLRPMPRVREAHNLNWLARHGFRAPRALCAGSIERGRAPLYQFLFSEYVPAAQPLDRALEGADSSLSISLLEELGRELAHLHASGFVHRDLYARNLLVTPGQPSPRGVRRLVFIDAWRGGARSLRGPDYDLACLVLEGAVCWGAGLTRAFFRAYFTTLERLSRPVDEKRLLAQAARRRRALLERVRRQPGRWRAPQPPPLDSAWDWESLMR
jgi:tRNA A-37 threonylcarbamoyl transferase component Bud32